MKEKNQADAISIDEDKQTSKAIMTIKKTGYQINFTKPKSLNIILGFKSKIYKDPVNTSEEIIKVTLTNDIDIHCNLISSNSYVNGINKPILYSVSAYSVDVGAKIIVSEIIPIYLPINTSVIDSIRFWIMDENEKLLNFNTEVIILECILTQL
jgi:hypothetical protein